MKKYLIFCLIVLSSNANAKLQAVAFPKTYADFTFAERIENAIRGYQPFMDKKAYTELNIVPGEEIYTDHMIATNEATTTSQPPTIETAGTTTTLPHGTQDSDEDTTYEQPSSSGTFPGKTIGGGIVVENNQVTGGSCYLAAIDRHFTNKVLTTGKYENINPAFEKSLITIFRKEGRCGTVANDPCGYTCYGIGSSPKCAGVVINSRAEAEDFYYERFWKKYKIYKLPDVISTDILIACMASGPGTALAQFRRFLGLESKSSAVDDEMVNAVKSYQGDIHNQWMDVRNEFLQDIAKKRYNGSVSRGYANAIEIKRKNGCHVKPTEPLYR